MGLQTTVDVPERGKEERGQQRKTLIKYELIFNTEVINWHNTIKPLPLIHTGFSHNIDAAVNALTFNGVVGSEGHLDVIPFQEAARPGKRLGKHNVLIGPKGERLHRNGLELQRLIGGKFCKAWHSDEWSHKKQGRGDKKKEGNEAAE